MTTRAWPTASELPDERDGPDVWARFYRDRLGWIVLPTPSPADLDRIASKELDNAILDWRHDYGADPTEEERNELWSLCRNSPDIRRRAKGVLGYVKAHQYPRPESVTDEDIRRWWGVGDGRERGIAVVPAAGHSPFVLVDVDQHGDDPTTWGDLDGPWGRGVDHVTGARLIGPQVSTPGGGLHTLISWTGSEVSSGGRTALAVGVEIKARGAAPVQVPAGSATGSRRWIRWEEPAPGPDAVRQIRSTHREREPGDDDEAFESGLVARVLRSPAGDGERNAGVAAIVGLLVRPGACPDDVVRAALELLAEDLAGPRERVGATQGREEAERWRHALTRGPRLAEFAAEVLACWIRVRDTGRPPWSEAKAERVARSIWKTAERRLASQGEEAGAEDFSVGPPIDARPEWLPVPTPAPAVEVGETHDPDAIPYPPPPPGTVPGAPRLRGRIDPRTYVHSLADFYTDDELTRDLEREPIMIDEVFPAWDFKSGGWLRRDIDRLTAPLFHGWGEALGHALGGMAAGDFRVIGAAGAKAGKTWFECWLAHGLALQTSARLLGVSGYERRPLVLPIWLTEMPKVGELYWRLVGAHLGFDIACISWGRQAADAPGVKDMAQKYGMTPDEVVTQARMLERMHGASDRLPLGVARRDVIKVLSLSDLPRHGKQNGVIVSHRGGPALVDHLADAVDVFRRELATRAAVSESEVLPLVMIDPGQRFIGESESEKRAIDALFSAVVQVLCRELGCIVLGTSDTTKAAAKEIGVDTFLSADSSHLAATIFTGSQGIMHLADVIALCSERPEPGALVTRQHVRVLNNRTGSPSVSYPFLWRMNLGRFEPQAPEPLRPPVPSYGGGGHRHHQPDTRPVGNKYPGRYREEC